MMHVRMLLDAQGPTGPLQRGVSYELAEALALDLIGTRRAERVQAPGPRPFGVGLDADDLANLKALLAWAGKGQYGQAGMVAVNNGQLVARSLVPGPGIEILYPTGVGGDPIIYTPPGRVLLGSLMGADLASAADQAIQIREYPWYIVRDIVVTNVSATPVAAAGGVYSTTGKGGRVLVGAGQSYTGLTDDSVALSLTMGTIRRLSGPAVYLSLTTPNGSACTADVYVFGDWLMG